MREYEAGPTASKFHQAQAFVKALMGPIGSGKSVACCMDIMMLAAQMPVGDDGKRRSRWLIGRNTYRELNDTTLQTWRDWFNPDDIGVWIAQDMKHVIEVEMDDGSGMYVEVLFRSLDKPEDVKKLLSLELTGAWLNEARELPKAVFDMLQGRVGRYPPAWLSKENERFPGIILLDTNPPDVDHWWYKVFETQENETYRLFKQPSGLAKDAENIENLPADYYRRLMHGKDQAWVDVYVHGQYGFVIDGKPVYQAYDDKVHVLEKRYKPDRREVYVGVDFGLTPAAVLAQKDVNGRWMVFAELVTEDVDAVTFGDLLATYIRENLRGRHIHAYGDPAGDDRAQTDKKTPIKLLRAAGIPIVACPFPGRRNDQGLRQAAVNKVLTSMTMTAEPRLGISPNVETLRKGLKGGYKYRRVQVSGDERYVDKPDKNKYSHVVEALEYLLVGAGESNALIRSSNYDKPKVIRTIRNRRGNAA